MTVQRVDPNDASRRAANAGLVLQRADPLNCETPVSALKDGIVVPNSYFYVRNHFQIPTIDPASWRLSIGGLVSRSLSLSLGDLQNLRTKTLMATLECAGNGRALLDPPTEGEQWGLGALSNAEWTGVPLVDVLDRAGVQAPAREVLFRGADAGTVAA